MTTSASSRRSGCVAHPSATRQAAVRALALCACCTAACSPFTADSNPAQPPVSMMASRTLDGPFAASLAQLGPLSNGGSASSVAQYDLVVLDGDYHTPAELQQDGSVLNAALAAGRPVLMLDLKDEHKLQALASLAGISIPGDTLALLVYRPTDGSSGWIYEFNPGDTAAGVPQESVDAFLKDVRAFVAGGYARIPTLQAAAPQAVMLAASADDCTSNPAQVKCMPEGLKSYKFDTYTVKVDYAAKNALLDPIMESGVTPWGNRNDFITREAWSALPNHGWAGADRRPQTPSYTLNFDVMLFGDTKESTFKYVYIAAAGRYEPGDMVSNQSWGGRLWFQSLVGLQYALADTKGLLTDVSWLMSSPQSRNEERKITDTIGFDVGFTAGASSKEGAKGEISGSFSFSHAEERTIYQWNMQETGQSPRNETGWRFFQESPWNAVTVEERGRVFDYEGTDIWGPKELPALSIGPLQIHTQALYSARAAALNKTLALSVSTVQWYHAFHYWSAFLMWLNRVHATGSFKLNIDLSKLDTKDFYSPTPRPFVVPTQYAADDPDFLGRYSLPFKWRDTPPSAKSLALVVEGASNVANWVVFNVAPPGASGMGELAAGASGTLSGKAVEGLNHAGRAGWTGLDRGTTYTARLYALDVAALTLNGVALGAGATIAQVRDAMRGHILPGFPVTWQGECCRN